MKTKLIEKIENSDLKYHDKNYLIQEIKNGNKNLNDVYWYLSSFKEKCEISHFLGDLTTLLTEDEPNLN
jgi:hypothetical protein